MLIPSQLHTSYFITFLSCDATLRTFYLPLPYFMKATDHLTFYYIFTSVHFINWMTGKKSSLPNKKQKAYSCNSVFILQYTRIFSSVSALTDCLPWCLSVIFSWRAHVAFWKFYSGPFITFGFHQISLHLLTAVVYDICKYWIKQKTG